MEKLLMNKLFNEYCLFKLYRYKKQTINSYKSYLREHIISKFGDRLYNDIKPKEVVEYYIYLYNKGLGINTIHGINAAFYSFCSYVNKKYIEDIICKRAIKTFEYIINERRINK